MQLALIADNYRDDHRGNAPQIEQVSKPILSSATRTPSEERFDLE
jgi:hypothetical protein